MEVTTMKKIILSMMFLLSCLVFSAKKDGIYYVEKASGNGWTSFVKLTIKSDRIIGVQYDRKNTDGELLSINQSENEKYRKEFGETFRDTSFKMTRSLVSSQNVNELESVRNTRALSEFREMVNYLIDKSNAGQVGNFKI